MTHPEYRQVYVTTGDFMAGSIMALLKYFSIDDRNANLADEENKGDVDQ